MIKLDRYDGRKMIEALKIIEQVRDGNYSSDTNPLYRKMCTICAKIEKVLETETRPELQEEYKVTGRI